MRGYFSAHMEQGDEFRFAKGERFDWIDCRGLSIFAPEGAPEHLIKAAADALTAMCAAPAVRATPEPGPIAYHADDGQAPSFEKSAAS